MKLYNLTNAYDKTRQEKFHDWSCEEHAKSNSRYSDYPYKLHLDAVMNVAKQYLYLIEKEDEKFFVLCSCDGHDLVEDLGVGYYNKIVNHELFKDNDGKKIADIIYNVTNELGKNRKERSEKTYPKIASCRLSTFVKLCDRIANAKFSYYINDEKGMYAKYQAEHPDFYKALHNPNHGFDDMWKEVNRLLL